MRVLAVRTAPTGKGRTVSGYAAVFNQPMSGDTEIIRPDAFRRTLESGVNIRALYNHDDMALLGTTKAGTLRLREDSHGLAFDLDLPDTTCGRDVLELVTRGDIAGCSFGFYVRGESVVNGVRELHDVELAEITLTPCPAYPQTQVSVRSDNRKRWLETC